MPYEYKVVPAPSKPRKGTRVKGNEAKFAHGLETVMNELATEGWEYQRSDILPSEERKGFASSHTVYRSVLVFRRAIDAGEVEAYAPPEEEMPVEMPDDSYAAEPASEPAPEPEPRAASFSSLRPSRRAEDSGAPPLAAPHVDGQHGAEDDHRYSENLEYRR